MNAKQLEQLEFQTGCKGIALEGADSVYVLFEPNYITHIVIAGEKGLTKVNKHQAIALATELMGIVETYMEDK